jgi:O-antigen/teichoic acid export membrane protein
MQTDPENPLIDEQGGFVEYDPKNLARRSVRSVTWNVIAHTARLPILFVQSVILARLLPVEYFGINAGVTAIIILTSSIAEFGFGSAYLHRSPETLDEERTTAVYFTLKFIFFTIWVILLLAFGIIFFSGLRQLVLIVLSISAYLLSIFSPARSLLVRRVQHGRLAFIDLTGTLLVFVCTFAVAVLTRSIWALLVTPIVMLIWSTILLYIWRPVWRPRFIWDPSGFKYYINFGSKTVVGKFLGVTLDKVDDLWTNLFLGDLSMGFYSRAYKFATYPRTLMAMPVNVVTGGTYSELKYDQVRLSQAFFRVNALLIRTGFLFAGWLAVIAPHFIVLFLGARWLPMLDAFRLMLIFTLFDPIKSNIGSLLLAVGKPEKVSLARLIQLVVLGAGLFILGSRFDIAGVALAVDLMLVVGIALVLFFTKPHVHFSIRRLFLVPTIALIVGLVLSWLATNYWDLTSSEWLAGFVKSIAFCLGYLLVLLGFEGKLLYTAFVETFSHIGIPAKGRSISSKVATVEEQTQ